ncbi:MAG: nicotinate-nucleotide adenylyltransferase [Pseudomonadota bacterium]
MIGPYEGLPTSGGGQTVGVFGGSFNPPHAGHRHVAQTALARLRLSALWWLVSPGNPLKTHDELAGLPQRLDAVAALARHPKMRVTAAEAALGTRYSADVVRHLAARRPEVRFVFVIGADNLLTFHKWQEWRAIFATMPVAVVSRPSAPLAAIRAPAARAFAAARIDESDAPRLAHARPPAWVFLNAPLKPVSSTDLRRRRRAFAPAS